MFIYKITNKLNGKCYIGLDTHAEHLQRRWKVHQNSNKKCSTKLAKALKYGIENFSYAIIDRADTYLDLAYKEIFWIKFYNSYKSGYNSTQGGEAMSRDLTKDIEESKDRISRR
jgi:group I intron endonuclease